MKKKLTIDEIVETELNRLSDEDKKALLENPDYIDHHFGYGMYIRNEYIHSGKMKDPEQNTDPNDPYYPYIHPDNLSEIIFEKIIEKIKKQ